jgi:hypothetical protein
MARKKVSVASFLPKYLTIQIIAKKPRTLMRIEAMETEKESLRIFL